MSLSSKLSSGWRQSKAVLARIPSDDRGAILVEYTVLVGAVAIAGAVGLIVVGIAIAESFEFVRGMLLIPIP